MTRQLLHGKGLSECLGCLAIVLTMLAYSGDAAEPRAESTLTNPAQQVVLAQALPAPVEEESLIPPASSEIPAPDSAIGNDLRSVPSAGGLECYCTSSIAQFYNTDCGCGTCRRCKTHHCNCGCCSKCQQRKRECQAKYWGYPEYFCERPFGSCNRGIMCKMIANGLKDQMVLYEYDFAGGQDAWRLKERGLLQLQKIVGRFHVAQTPVVIQASSDPQLDSQRQAHVLAALSELGLELSSDMVVVNRPGVRGLDGVEGIPIYRNLLEQGRLRGNVGIETSALTDIGFGSSAIGTAPAASPNQGQ